MRSLAERTYRAAIRAIQDEIDSSASKAGARGKRANARLRLVLDQGSRAQRAAPGWHDPAPDFRVVQRCKIDTLLAVADRRGACAF
jgi:hypothetical protein